MTSEEEQETRVRRLERRLNSLSIVGAHGVLVAGHFEQGFSVDVRRKAGTIGACCVGSECFEATQQQCSTLGGSYFGDGVPCEPSPCPTVGACCIDGVCTIRTEASCVDAGGEYQGDGTDCDPNPCEQPSGACCFNDGTCEVKTEDQCIDAGGVYQGDDTVCDPNPCPQPGTGACCIGTHGDCTPDLTEDDCVNNFGGFYQGDGTTCTPNPCECCNFVGFLGQHGYRTQTITVDEIFDCSELGDGTDFTGENSFYEIRGSGLAEDGCPEPCIGAGGTSDKVCIGEFCVPCHKDYECGGFVPGITTCYGLYDSAGLGWCAASGTTTNISDSEQQFVGVCSPFINGSCTSITLVITTTLSELCADF